MKILVTGASGFVGSQLLKAWAAKDYQIRALVRKSSLVQEIKNLPVDLYYGDVMDPLSLKKSLEDMEAVIHLASKVGETGKREEFFNVNLEGTRNILEVCRSLPLKRFVHVSSLSVITGYKDHDGTDETAPYLPTDEHYANSKIEAEKLVMEYHHRYGIPVTVLRPGFIYGPGDWQFLPTVIENLRQGKVILIDQGKKLLNLTYVGNLIEAIELALGREEAVGEIFNITDGEKVSKKQFFDSVADLTELPRPSKSVPFFLASLVCKTFTYSYKLLGKKTPPPLSRMKLRFAGQNQWFDISKARKKLGYSPKFSFEESIPLAVQSCLVKVNSISGQGELSR